MEMDVDGEEGSSKKRKVKKFVLRLDVHIHIC